jgi:peptidoglycan hydrolase-like protein with peptidoglycan-binding domain
MPLHSVPFTNSLRLADIEKGGPPMIRRESGYATALVQAGLVDLGFKLPFSTLPDGTPDGLFGNETYAAVRQFQAKNGLRVDGAGGVKTIASSTRPSSLRVRRPRRPPPRRPR